MKKKVIIIDDSSDFLDMLITVFPKYKLHPWNFMMFQDAFEAMFFITKNGQMIKAVFTDFHMESKGMTGSIIAEKCLELAIPVYIMTGDTASVPKKWPTISKTRTAEEIANILKQTIASND